MACTQSCETGSLHLKFKWSIWCRSIYNYYFNIIINKPFAIICSLLIHAEPKLRFACCRYFFNLSTTFTTLHHGRIRLGLLPPPCHPTRADLGWVECHHHATSPGQTSAWLTATTTPLHQGRTRLGCLPPPRHSTKAVLGLVDCHHHVTPQGRTRFGWLPSSCHSTEEALGLVDCQTELTCLIDFFN